MPMNPPRSIVASGIAQRTSGQAPPENQRSGGTAALLSSGTTERVPHNGTRWNRSLMPLTEAPSNAPHMAPQPGRAPL